jgi:hypothetical protein
MNLCGRCSDHRGSSLSALHREITSQLAASPRRACTFVAIPDKLLAFDPLR